MTFSPVVYLPLPSSHVVYPVFFLNSATIILGRELPLEVVTRGGPPTFFPHSDATATIYRLRDPTKFCSPKSLNNGDAHQHLDRSAINVLY